ncbi:MAG TPA: gentisate 1,2-dioxygenase [Bryobacteraceae bacterium]|nr:gentisate 1,2-dioxygenase [Bryobacteraceae bacterium]
MESAALYPKPESSPEREEFYRRLHQRSAAPLWEVLGDLIPTRPQPQCVPALWPYAELRPLLMEAGKLITAREAARRVLILENPGTLGASRITGSLYAGLQLVLPGEDTPTHRHTASALRFVIESRGGYTAVDGERTTMQPSDFIITPSWTFHDHGNPSSEPVVWLDGLDLPIVNLFDTGFAEHYPGEIQPVTRAEGDALLRYGSNMLPVDYKPGCMSTPIFCYPYSRSRETLEHLYRNGPVDARDGVKMQYINPSTGGSPMPAIAAFLQLLPSGFQGQPYRSTEATVFCVAEGTGVSRIGGKSFEWRSHDIFVVPSWQPISHAAREDSILFSFSDRPAQQALGLWREE